MDNAIIVDGVLAAVLIIGALVGAKRGLFKSLMGLLVVVAAMVGAVVLANMLTEPIANVIAPKAEDAIVKRFSDELDRSAGDSDDLGALLEKYGVSAELRAKIFAPFASSASGAASSLKESATSTFRSAISATVRATVSGAVHAVLTLVLYVVLLVVLRLAVNLLNHVFDLPILGTVNGLGGAALGLLEAAALLYVVVYLGSHFGVKVITEHAQDTHLLAFFLNHSPVELISSFTQKG